jgi:gamma-glutamylputrescine oxidase
MNDPVWDDGDWPGLPSLENDVVADFCVVGLGGSGLAAVHELISLGANVVGIDAGQVAGGAAGRNGGFLLAGAAHGHHRAVEAIGRAAAVMLHQLTLDEIDRMASDTPEAVQRVGSLRIASSKREEADCEVQAAALRRDGFAVKEYDGPEGVGLLFPDDAAAQPLHRCRVLATRAAKGGAHLFEHTPALTITGTKVRTPAATITCGAVVVCIDGRLDTLFPELAGRVRTARLQMLATAPTEEVRVQRPVYARWGYDYWQQLTDGRIALGGQRDQFEHDEWTNDAAPTEPVQAALERVLREVVGVKSTPITHRWAASAGFTANGFPVCEQLRDRVFVAGGYSGTGNVIGAVCGRRLACLAAGRPDPYPVLASRA